MELTRRQSLAIGAGAVAVASLPVRSVAAQNDAAAVIAAFTGGVEPQEGGVEITAPEIAENGSSVPVAVSAPGARAILLVAPGNPNQRVATFNFGTLSASAKARTRIRLAQSQELVAVARTDHGFVRASRMIEVVVGGCA